MKIRFPECGLSGRTVVTVKKLEFGFEDKVRMIELEEMMLEIHFYSVWTYVLICV